MDDLTRAIDTARESAGGGVNEIVATLAERVGNRTGAHAVFGAPVEQGGVTVIPVARVRWGFGGGGGRGDGSDRGEGTGGGGGAAATPAGYIRIADGTAEFRRIAPPVSPGTIVAAAVAVYLVLRGLRALVR